MLRHLPHVPHHFKYPDYKYPELSRYSDLAGLAHYEDVDHLITELEQEKRHRDTIEWSNAELERSVAELESYYRDLTEDRSELDDNEWKVRFEAQMDLNKQLNEQREWLEAELLEIRKKMVTGSYPEAKKYNLDTLNEPELLRLVKHLERTRNNLYSILRDMEWKLDKESKEFRHFDEIRRTCRADLKQVNHTLERLQWTRVVEPSGVLSPIYTNGYPYWVESQGHGLPLPPYSKSLTYPAGGRHTRARREMGGTKGDSNQSPTRAKSRAEKKGKKKQEAPPPEAETKRRNGNNETETDNPADPDEVEEGKESNPSSGADTYIKEAESKTKRKPSVRPQE